MIVHSFICKYSAALKQSCRKVMFSHMFVCLHGAGGGTISLRDHTPVGPYPLWHHTLCGTIPPVGPYLLWDHYRLRDHTLCGTIPPVGPYLLWDHTPCGTIPPVGPCLLWHHTSCVTIPL